jgi:hypothetical protein
LFVIIRFCCVAFMQSLSATFHPPMPPGVSIFRQWGHGWIIATASGFTAWGLHAICSRASGAFLLSTGGNSYCHGYGVETCWHCRGAHADDARAGRRNRCLRRSIHSPMPPGYSTTGAPGAGAPESGRQGRRKGLKDCIMLHVPS